MLNISTRPIENFLAGISQIVLDTNVLYPQYRNNPVGFAKDILGISWTDKIKEIAVALLQHPKVAVPAGHGVGKTHGVAGIALWWLSTRRTIIVSTAPTWRQVIDLIWRELRYQHRNAVKTLPGHPITSKWDMQDEENWYAIGLSTNKSERFQGYHSDELLILIDEASGIEKFIWEAIEDGLAVGDDNRILAIGNPTDPTGRFAQVCRSSDWKTFTLSCLDHPNVKEGRPIIRRAVGRRWVTDRIERWCIPYEDIGEQEEADTFEFEEKLYIPNDMFRIRILGQFPIEGGQGVFPLHRIERAFNREPIEPEGKTYMGLDVARFGDDLSVLTVGSENGAILKVDPWQGNRTTESTGRVKYWVSEFQPVESIAVDEIGVGAGVVDELAEANYPVIGVNVARKPYDESKYVLLRDELTFMLADRFAKGEIDLTRVRTHEEMITEELSSIEFDYQKGRRKVASKAKIKEKLGRSPDFADSLYLWNAYTEVGEFKAETVKKIESWDNF